MSRTPNREAPAATPGTPVDPAPWSGTLQFRRYREPFFPEFFARATAAIGLNGSQALIDLGCGTGRIALGLAPHTWRLVGVDAELPMLEQARREAARRDIAIELVHSPIEDFDAGGERFECATLGNVHWWLEPEKTHRLLDRLLGESGKVFICTALPLYDAQTTPWLSVFLDLRRRANPFDYGRTRLSAEEFMQGSPFVAEVNVVHAAAAHVPVEHLVRRALGYHPTSPQALGEQTGQFAEQLRRALQPYADRQGRLLDKCYNAGVVFRRR